MGSWLDAALLAVGGWGHTCLLLEVVVQVGNQAESAVGCDGVHRVVGLAKHLLYLVQADVRQDIHRRSFKILPEQDVEGAL